MAKYDRTMKLLVDGDPRAIAQFVLDRSQLPHSLVIEVEVLGQLNTEFQGTEAEADGLLLATTADGRMFLIHIEFQSKRDPFMGDRMLDYCIRARHKHSPKEGPALPIISCVIYLRDNGHVAEPPLLWELFNGQHNLIFDYVCIKLYELPRDEILRLNQPGLLPLSLLTKGEINRTIVTTMFEALKANKLYDLLPVGYTIATWVLGATNLEWLRREYYKMLDFFKDSPAYAWMTEDAREEVRKETQQQIQQLEQQLQQQTLEVQQQKLEAQQQTLEVQQQALEKFRQTVVALVTERFPALARLAKRQVHTTEDVNLLQQAILHCSLAQDMTEVEILLLDLDKDRREDKK